MILNKRRLFIARGFTLVELLVVISIIAILLAILMPSLRKARAQAQKIVCMTHIRSLAQGIHVYGQDYNGNIPSSRNGMNAALSYLIWSNYGGLKEYVNMGRLYDRKIIDDPSVFYCPAQPNKIVGREEVGWNYVRNSGAEEKATSYTYGLLGQINNIPSLKMTSLKLTDLKQRALVCDVFVLVKQIPTWAHPKGLNVGFGDGHVVFFSVTQHPKLIAGAAIMDPDGTTQALYRADAFVACMFELLGGKDSYMRTNYSKYYP